ncbi:MAG: 2-C-methyl-D-erythritol 2,4-cyclodiphosphate synthase [Clostridiales bacterium]|nr:2-C-methyl-D-erythritol 2,4-cyclodiphosphate synthase [Clostridiales bacterium]
MGFDKLITPLAGQAPLLRSALALIEGGCDCLVVAGGENIRAFLEQAELPIPVTFVPGGQTRFHSARNALAVAAGDIAVIHDAARPMADADLVRKCIKSAATHGSGVAAIPMADTVLRREGAGAVPVPRETLWRMQTPQAFSLPMIQAAYAQATPGATDDATVFLARWGKIHFVSGSERNRKLTTPADWSDCEQMLQRDAEGVVPYRPTVYGTGFDTHRLVAGRPLVLGGVTVPYEKGLLGHSDADVLLHAIADALLGACALGDIGQHFPDSDPRYKDADSRMLLRETASLLHKQGKRARHVDATIVCEKPKLAPHIPQMRENIAADLGLPLSAVSVKATTTEGQNDEGRGLCVSAQALVTV